MAMQNDVCLLGHSFISRIEKEMWGDAKCFGQSGGRVSTFQRSAKFLLFRAHVIRHPPSKVFLQLGENDLDGEDRLKTQLKFYEIVEELRALCPSAMIYVGEAFNRYPASCKHRVPCTPPRCRRVYPDFNWSRYQRNRLRWNRHLRAKYSDNPRVQVVSYPWDAPRSNFLPDGVHLSPAGTEQYRASLLEL